MNKNKLIIITLIIIIMISLLLFILPSTKKTGSNEVKVNNKANGVKKNTNKEVLKSTKVKELDLTDISISYVKGSGSTYSAKISNNTKETINLESFDIVFKNKEDKEITTITVFVGGEVLPKQENIVKSTIPEDITDATKVEYKIN